MKHAEWLCLQTEGENVCAILRQQDYQCLKQTRRLSWKVSKEGTSYLLTWLPAPVSDWSVIPNDTNPARDKLVRVVQNTLNKIRGGEALLSSPTPDSRLPTPQPEDFTRPWAIIRLLPDLRRYTVARFYNRTDAQDHLRLLYRFIPAAEFEVIFDVPPDFADNVQNLTSNQLKQP